MQQVSQEPHQGSSQERSSLEPAQKDLGSGLWVSLSPTPLSLSPHSKELSSHLVGLWVLVGLGWKALQEEEKVRALRG